MHFSKYIFDIQNEKEMTKAFSCCTFMEDKMVILEFGGSDIINYGGGGRIVLQ